MGSGVSLRGTLWKVSPRRRRGGGATRAGGELGAQVQDQVRAYRSIAADLQSAIALVKKSITDFPVQFGNFRD